MMMMMMTLTVREGGGGWELLVKYGGIRHAYELHFQRWIGEKQDSRALGRVLDARALTFAMYWQSAVFSVCVCVLIVVFFMRCVVVRNRVWMCG